MGVLLRGRGFIDNFVDILFWFDTISRLLLYSQTFGLSEIGENRSDIQIVVLLKNRVFTGTSLVAQQLIRVQI